MHLWSCVAKDACSVHKGICQNCRMIGIAANVIEVIEHYVTAGLQIDSKLCCELPLALCHFSVYRQQHTMSCIHKFCQRCAVDGAAEICDAGTQACCLTLADTALFSTRRGERGGGLRLSD
jgi:hypothetical protein